jgi:hypothetical protein
VRVEWDASIRPPYVVDPPWQLTGNMTTPRRQHLQVRLSSGLVLAAAGDTTSSAELYNPTTNTWAATGSLSTRRDYGAGAITGTGSVLMTGGYFCSSTCTYFSSAELYNPATGTWAATGSMSVPRRYHTATSLATGGVLVAGGFSSSSQLSTAEVFGGAAFSAAGAFTDVRSEHQATRLGDGRVLLAGGASGSTTVTVLASASLYNPSTNSWSAANPMLTSRYRYAMVTLNTGDALAIGGIASGSTSTADRTAERYEVSSGLWRSSGTLYYSRSHTSAAVHSNGLVLLAGGNGKLSAGADTPLSSAEVFNLGTTTWSGVYPMSTERLLPRATLLGNGRILVAGGSSTLNGTTSTAETFGFSAPGQSCNNAGECVSSPVCKDGVCCDSACNGTCQSCTLTPGTCATVRNATDDTCTGNNSCDANGQCKLANGRACTTNSECASAICFNGFCCGSTCAGPCYGCSSGTCQLLAAGTPSPGCVAYSCGGSANCPTSCTSDVGCAPGYYCNAAGSCVARKTTGSACNPSAGADCYQANCGICASGQCVDGFCCNAPCSGPCDVCALALGATADGTCSFAPAGYPGVPSCGAYTCDGTGANCSGASCNSDQLCGAATYCSAQAKCEPRKLDGATCDVSAGADCLVAGCRACSSGFCVDGVCCEAACAGSCDSCSITPGKCLPAPAGSVGAPSCATYVCNGTAADCPASCAGDQTCATSAHCAGNACVADLANGQPCTSGAECVSGYCVDGVCCETACTALCQACAAARKTTGADGICGDALSATDPHSDCAASDPNSCQTDGLCDGSGACRMYANTQTCGVTSCDGDTVQGSLCNGFGACAGAASSSCAPYACASGSCKQNCATDLDCATGSYCAGGECLAQTPLGAPCQSAAECPSRLCVDGVCCNAPCQGTCEACNEPGTEGSCVAVAGQPRGGRPACGASNTADPCAVALCDGTERTSCVSFVGSDVVCRPASCSNGVATLAASCDGRGSCPAAQTKRCEPYVCDAEACKTSCSADADCTTGFKCQVGAGAGECVSSAEATCDGDHTVTSADGQDVTDCSPLKCNPDGTCKATCAVSTDCVKGFVCVKGACESTGGAEQTDEAGCGCRTVSPEGRSAVAWLGGLLALCAALRRSRRSTRRS